MFQFRRFPSYTYGFSIWYHNMTYGGLLHSVIPGSKSAYDSPRHFVVSHDLLRLPMPRHSLCALCSLTIELCLILVWIRNCSHLPKIFSWIFDSFPHLHLLSLFSFQDTLCPASRWWWAQVDSNHRPHAYQACALTTWAMSPCCYLRCVSPTCPSSSRKWWRWTGSNRWPPACKAGALPAELYPRSYLLWVSYSLVPTNLKN